MQLTLNIEIETQRNKKDSSHFIDLLKQMGIPGNVAYIYVQRYSLEYIARKILLCEYYKPTNIIGYLRSAIEYDYQETDKFCTYRKQRAKELKDKILGGYL